MRRLLVTLVGLTLLLLPGRHSGAADGGQYVLIVNPKLAIDRVERGFVRDAYLGKVASWPGGATVRPLDLGAAAPERRRFGRELLGKSPAQLRAYWNQRVFSGNGTPPPSVESGAAAVTYVLATPGAIAYIPADVGPGGARVVQLE